MLTIFYVNVTCNVNKRLAKYEDIGKALRN